VIGGEAPLVRGEGSAARRRVERDLSAAPVGVRRDRADGVDRGELLEADDAVLHGIAAAADPRQQRGVRGRERVERGGVVGARWRVRDQIVERGRGAGRHLREPEPRREERVQELELAMGVGARAVRRRQRRDPARDELPERNRDAEDAARIQPVHQVEVACPQCRRRERRFLGDQRREPDLVELRLEVLEAPILRELEPALVDEPSIRRAAFGEVARVVANRVVGEHRRDAQLVAAPEVDVDACGILRTGREPGVKGRLALVVEDAVARRILHHETRLGAVAREARRRPIRARGNDREQASQQRQSRHEPTHRDRVLHETSFGGRAT
jgi:hypothetical protein